MQAGAVLVGITYIEKHSVFFQTFNILCLLYLIYLGVNIF